jgi:transposase
VTAWLVPLMRRRAQKIAAVALGNKIARILWAMMVRDEPIALRSR